MDLTKLSGVDNRLADIIRNIAKYLDITVVTGARTIEEQKKLVEAGRSKTMNSKHVLQPAQAVDITVNPPPKSQTVIKSKICGWYYECGAMYATQILFSTSKSYGQIKSTDINAIIKQYNYPISSDDINYFYFVGGFMLCYARLNLVKLRWGGDWNMNNRFDDNKFDDLYHFELI